MSAEAVYRPSLSLRLQLALKAQSGASMRELMVAAGTDPADLSDVSDAETLLDGLRRMGHLIRDRRSRDTLEDRFAFTEAGREYLQVIVPSGEAPDVEARELAL
jgi:hypothetical protein